MEELPVGWCFAQLNDLLKFVIGGDWGKAPEFTDEEYDDVLCIRGAEFKKWSKLKASTASLRKIKKASLEKRRLQLGDILIEISGGGPDQPVGRTVLIDETVLGFKAEIPKICTNFLRLARSFNSINSVYLQYYLSVFYMSGEVVRYQSGSNNLRNLKFKDYNQISIPLPPLNEQIRIANKLDSLLAKVEVAQARLDKIPTLLKRFRQSVLAAATSGKLTKEWREENRLSNPIKTTISSIGSLSGGKTPSKSNKAYWENGNIPWVSPKDMKLDVIYSSIDMITDLAFNKASMKLYPKNSVLMVTRSGILAHSFPVVVAKVPVTVNQDLKVFSASDEQIDTDYLAIALRGNSHKILRECSKDGTTVSSIETSKLERFEFDLPVLEEQKQIVQQVESLFTLADKVEKHYQQARLRTDKLTQSLLAKAFKGELVPQDPNDEPAEKLLARIQAEREKLKPAKKPR